MSPGTPLILPVLSEKAFPHQLVERNLQLFETFLAATADCVLIFVDSPGPLQKQDYLLLSARFAKKHSLSIHETSHVMFLFLTSVPSNSFVECPSSTRSFTWINTR